MGDSADTAREKLAAKRVPKRKPKKPSADARAFAAATSIFVPPELQHIGATKAPPRSVVFTGKPKKETVPQKRKRQAQETKARERLQLGFKISHPTGPNRLDAVPVYHPPPSRRVKILGGLASVPRFIPGTDVQFEDVGRGIAQTGEALGRAGAETLRDWGSDVADAPGEILRSIIEQSQPGATNRRSRIPGAIQRAGAVAGEAEPLVRPVGKTAAFLATEKGQEEIWGKSLVNLALHGDVPNSKGETAGLTIGILGILPLGKLTAAVRGAKALKAAGKIGEALPDSPARTAFRAALTQRLGQEQADTAMLLFDNVARNTHKDDPLQWYETTTAHATNAADFMASPGAKTALFQTEPGNRYGIVEGAPGRGAMKPLTPQDAFRTAALGDEVHFMTDEGDYAILSKRGDDFTLTVTDDASNEIRHETVTASWAREALRDSPVVPFHHLDEGTGEVPIFQADLPAAVAKLPAEGHTRMQTEATLKKAVKPAEWEDSGMQDFVDQYPKTAKIPRAAIESHLSTSLNAYDLDETVRASPSLDFPTRYGSRGDFEGLTVRQDSLDEPYYELTMSLRTPLHTQIRRSIMGGHPRVNAPYSGKGAAHWRGETDVVAHVRFHIIVDAEGKKALLVDEIQSDWASEWRKLKAAGGHAAIRAKIDEISEQIAALDREVADRHLNPHEYDAFDDGDIYQVENRIEDLRFQKQDLQRFHDEVPGAPPLGQKQMQAAVRRTLRFAHDADVDRIIIIGGDVQALRNVGYRSTPKGEVINLHDLSRTYEQRTADREAWMGAFEGMGPDEIKAWLNWEGHADTSPMVKTFRRLYGSPEKPRGEIAEMFEKEMGEQGGIKQGIFSGGYADMYGSIQRTSNGTAMDGYVIEMTPAAKAKARVPMRYYQTAANPADLPNGAAELFADGTRAIHLFENANISTIIHELAHVSIADLSDVDRAILARHFDFGTTAGNEAYARALERYVYDGMAMESELDGVFQKIAAWMKAVYVHVNQIGGFVHPEVKQVFDRLLVKPESPAEQLVRLLKSAPDIRKAQQAGYSEERGRRAAAAMEALGTGGGGMEGYRAALVELMGELPKQEYNGLSDLTPEVRDALLDAIRLHPHTRTYQKVRAMGAIVKGMEGQVPTRSELALLEKIFGKSVGFRKVHRNHFDEIMVEIWNIPRSLSASLDLSAPLRQGLVAGARHPLIFKRNIGPMVKSLRVKNYEDLTEQIATRPTYPLMKRAKLAVDTSASDASWANREEAFYSSYADRIPGVKHSANAYAGFLHKMRADVFDHMLAAAQKKNIDVMNDEFLEGLGMYVNSITGRGIMPDTELFPFEKAAPFFNTLFFSPRLLASRINMISPFYYAKLWRQDPFIAKQAMRAMLHTVGGTVATLGIAAQMPGVDVGLDPTSANFGKIRIGDTRIDTMAGFGPLMVLIARETYGRSTSSSTGKTQNLEGGFGKSSRKDILYRFGESKFAPTTGILKDLLDQKTFIGEDVTWQSEAKNVIPMMARDAWEVGHEPGDPTEAAVAAAAVVVLGGLGLGFSSYPDRTPKPSSSKTEDESENPFEADSGEVESPFDEGGGQVENPFGP